ncbi:MAG TPA: 2-phospho-L-lactate transferase [Bryobacteraceae bacterium]|nr:2-phospho-L-lactate transferase [Bryobacteraceae bacterium]
MLVALAGGIGAARFLQGLVTEVPPETVFIAGNTGDDTEIYGLHISPDLDTVIYTLAGLANPLFGWGLAGDTFGCLAALGRLGAETWFQLGDSDLATHIFRTQRLRSGATLAAVTAEIARSLGVRATVCPATNDPVRTIVHTPSGRLPFQTYFVRRHASDRVLRITFSGARVARPAMPVLKAIRAASGIVFCPSNPFISIGPILAVPGLRRALKRRPCPAAAISPIVGGRAIKGPTADMMASFRLDVSPLGIARHYRGLIDILVIDRADRELAPEIERLGIRTVVTNTVMTGIAEKRALACATVQALARHGARL